MKIRPALNPQNGNLVVLWLETTISIHIMGEKGRTGTFEKGNPQIWCI